MGGISLQQIEVFLTVAGCQNILQASKKLYISQPAVSRLLKKMEDSLGVALFERNNRGVTFTPYGARFYAQLDPVYQRYRVAMDKIISQYDTVKAPFLNIGCLHEPYIIAVMRNAIDRYTEKYKEASVEYELFNYQELREKLLCGDLDVIFTLSFDVLNNPEINCKELIDIEQYFLAPARWKTSASKDFIIPEGMPLLLEVHNGRDTMLSICEEQHVIPSSVEYTNSFSLLINMIAEGKGFTIGSKYFPGADMYKSDVVFSPISSNSRRNIIRCVTAWRKNRAPKMASELIALLDSSHFSSKSVQPEYTGGSGWYTG